MDSNGAVKKQWIDAGEICLPIEIHVDESLDMALFTCKKSFKNSGKVVFLEIDGFIPSESGGIEIEIKPTSMKDIFGGTPHEGNISEQMGNTYNNTLVKTKEGVFMDDPFKQTKYEVSRYFTFMPLKLSFAAFYSAITWFFSTAPYSQIGYFTIVALIDWILAIFPGVHKKEANRFSTSYTRFIQWGAAIFIGAGLMAAEQLAISSNSTGLGGWIAKHIFGLGMGFIIGVYVFRFIGVMFVIFYGSKADKVRGKMASFFPKKLQSFIKDKDITG